MAWSCCNCDGPIGSHSKNVLYCSDLCSDTAEFVRYSRRVRADGRIHRPDVRDSLRVQFAWIVSGGYPARQRVLDGEMRSLVIARDKGKCRICGDPGTEIDHISDVLPADGLNQPDNLQLLCHACHTAKTLSRIGPLPADHPQVAMIRARQTKLRTRVESHKPLRECDDHDRWPRVYQALKNERQRAGR